MGSKLAKEEGSMMQRNGVERRYKPTCEDQPSAGGSLNRKHSRRCAGVKGVEQTPFSTAEAVELRC